MPAPDPFPDGEFTDVFFAASPLYSALAETGRNKQRHTEIVIVALLLNLDSADRAKTLEYLVRSMKDTLN